MFKFEENSQVAKKNLPILFDFPELKSSATKKEQNIPVLSNYMDMVTKETEVEENDICLIPEGCIRLFFCPKTRKLIIEPELIEEPEKSFNDHVQDTFMELFASWDNYKRDFIEFHGEDAWPKNKVEEETDVEEEEDYYEGELPEDYEYDFIE